MQANDSILTGAAGAAVATHAPGDGKEYQVVVMAGSDGHLAGSCPVFRLTIPSQAVGANKVMADLFNDTGSGKKLRVLSAFAYPDIDTAVTGTLGAEIMLTRTTAVGTGGTAATAEGNSTTAPVIAAFDLANTLPAQITARAAPAGGATAGAMLGRRWVFTEETNAGSAIAGALGAEFVRNEGAEVIVPEGGGLRFVQGAVATVGSISFEITFELV